MGGHRKPLRGQETEFAELREALPGPESWGVGGPIAEGDFAAARWDGGTRGTYRVDMRHGVSRLRSGRRYTVGIISHDAT